MAGRIRTITTATHTRMRQAAGSALVPLVATMPLLAALLSAPADAAANATAHAVVVTDTSRTVWAWLNPVAEPGWRGVVQVQESTLSDGRATLSRVSTLTMNIWRRTCDISGCLETVMSASDLPLTSRAWAADLRTAKAGVSNAAVRVQLYRVTDSALIALDDMVRLTTVSISATSSEQEFAQSSSAKGSGVTTITRLRRMSAQATVAVGALRLPASQASIAQATSLTTAVKPARSR